MPDTFQAWTEAASQLVANTNLFMSSQGKNPESANEGVNQMTKFHPWSVVVLLLCAMGLWGCNQQKGGGAINSKIRELETRYAKLEEDFRTLQATNEQNRKRMNQAESQRDALEAEKTELTKQFEDAAKERDVLRGQVAQRTQERDSVQANLMQFSKDLQALAGRLETAANGSGSPTLPIINASRRNE
jgi:archaellum component FlaC